MTRMSAQAEPRIAGNIVASLQGAHETFKSRWQSASPFRHIIVDDLLPQESALELAASLPDPTRLNRHDSIRERKSGGNPEIYSPHLNAHLAALRDASVIATVSEITGIKGLCAPWPGSVSMMGPGDFLNPHVDHSHDDANSMYRVLNLLYYISPEWKLENGGNLELWDKKISAPLTIVSAFNRLVIFETNQISWHSVNQVIAGGYRACVTSYYFSPVSPTGKNYYQVTTFAGRPEETFKRIALKADRAVRNAIGRAFPGITNRGARAALGRN
jgi:Rps23 Pro-64 3,4-dihydroxylase Tpa1-like proline 4-hydroxylase